jgi:hypothetical protein
MNLTQANLTTLKNAILAETNPAFVTLRTAGDQDGMTAWYNGASTLYCWRTNVSRIDIYNNTSAEATTWSWTFYKNQSVTEQNAWVQMFMGDQADFSQANLRTGISQIFTSASAANATHALAIGKRLALLGEKVFASFVGGNGAQATPGTFGLQGNISAQNISDALLRG